MRVRTRTETRYWISYCVTCARSFRMCYIVFFFRFFMRQQHPGETKLSNILRGAVLNSN